LLPFQDRIQAEFEQNLVCLAYHAAIFGADSTSLWTPLRGFEVVAAHLAYGIFQPPESNRIRKLVFLLRLLFGFCFGFYLWSG
jgi:hypothetical protein